MNKDERFSHRKKLYRIKRERETVGKTCNVGKGSTYMKHRHTVLMEQHYVYFKNSV